MDIAVVGSGYVGLVVGASLASVGNRVLGYDTHAQRLEALSRGVCEMYEPGLAPLVAREVAAGRLQFTASLEEVVQHAEVIFISVPTPARDDGSADLSAVAEVATAIGDAIEAVRRRQSEAAAASRNGARRGARLVVVKSTVPVGTSDFIESIIASRTTRDFVVVSNPEFFREGSALRDFQSPARVVIGTDDARARTVLERLYDPFLSEGQRILFMDRRSAELTKYANNAMLALRIAFMNELAEIAEATCADIEQIRRGVGSDPRVGPRFLKAGIGFGGTCMTKDIEALIGVGREYSTEAPLLQAMHASNARQWQRIVEKLESCFDGALSGRPIAVWGATYKPGTSDIRDSPAIRIIDALLERGAQPVVYEPAALASLQARYGERVRLVDDEYAALEGADGLCVLTDWDPFKTPDFRRIRESLRCPVVFDGRNLYDPQTLDEHGLLHYSIGRPDPDRMLVIERLGAAASVWS